MGSRGQGHNPPNANPPASRSDNAGAESRIPACNVNFVDKKVIRGANRGILGDLTTFSAFSLDAALVIERNANLAPGAYILISVSVAAMGLFLGLLIDP
jgi:fluoride ion exporter CrcB/FEX